MDDNDSLGTLGDELFNAFRIYRMVVGYIGENRDCASLHDCERRCDEGIRRYNDLVPRADEMCIRDRFIIACLLSFYKTSRPDFPSKRNRNVTKRRHISLCRHNAVNYSFASYKSANHKTAVLENPVKQVTCAALRDRVALNRRKLHGQCLGARFKADFIDLLLKDL